MKSRSLILGLAMAALGPLAHGASEILSVAQTATAPRRRQVRAAHSSGGSHVTRTGPGWTAAHVKRMARKARNQRRHKSACKGGAA